MSNYIKHFKQDESIPNRPNTSKSYVATLERREKKEKSESDELSKIFAPLMFSIKIVGRVVNVNEQDSDPIRETHTSKALSR
jgi:hypothetical protein